VAGLGLGTSSWMMQTAFPPGAGGVAHNEYLRLGVDSGAIGVLLFALAAFVWLGEALRAGWSRAPGVAEFALPALAGILAWSVISVTDNPFDYYSPFTQFIGFLVGGAVVLAREREPSTSLDPSQTPGYLANRV
jgi:O-antigen ligase